LPESTARFTSRPYRFSSVSKGNSSKPKATGYWLRTTDYFTCISPMPEIILPAMQINKTASTVFTPLDDGTGVLLNIETRVYYSLNRTGSMLWKLLEEVQSVSLDDLVLLTCERFDINEEKARISLLTFVDHLNKFKMIRIS
jgi:hypothetical protein